MITYTEALEIVLAHAATLPSEQINLSSSVGRYLAENIFADRDYPPFNRAAMDGIAFRFQDIQANKSNSLTIVEHIFPGQANTTQLQKNQCYKIMTGAAVPAAADTIVKIENCVVNNNHVQFTSPETIRPFQHIAHQGEDAKHNSIILHNGSLIKPNTLAALASVGRSNVSVFAMPKIAILTTGNEVIPIDQMPNQFQIRNSNQYTLEGLCQKLGIKPTWILKANDTKEDIGQAISQCSKADVIIITGGVSMGAADFVPEVLSQLGFDKLFHKVKIKPGKPILFCQKHNTKVFALPGNPMSVITTFKIFVEPFLLKSLGANPNNYQLMPISIERKQKTPLDEFFPCIINPEGRLEYIAHHGSGDFISSLAATGLALHNSQSEIIRKGEQVQYFPWN